jgi:hypothetical protein
MYKFDKERFLGYSHYYAILKIMANADEKNNNTKANDLKPVETPLTT